MKREKLNAGWINTIHETVAVAFAQAVKNDTEVEFDFNGINCVVSATTDTTTLMRDYFNAHLMEWKEIGPNPVAEYSTETFTAIETAKAEQARKDAERHAEYERKEAAKLEAFNKEVEGVEMELSNPEAWNSWKTKNTDPYGKGCVDFAEGWAKLMQKHMAEGKTLEECADADSHSADVGGITGFMYGAATQMLAQCWKHGAELKKWHNTKYGQPEAEGTVNPAVMTFVSKEE